MGGALATIDSALAAFHVSYIIPSSSLLPLDDRSLCILSWVLQQEPLAPNILTPSLTPNAISTPTPNDRSSTSNSPRPRAITRSCARLPAVHTPVSTQTVHGRFPFKPYKIPSSQDSRLASTKLGIRACTCSAHPAPGSLAIRAFGAETIGTWVQSSPAPAASTVHAQPCRRQRNSWRPFSHPRTASPRVAPARAPAVSTGNRSYQTLRSSGPC